MGSSSGVTGHVLALVSADHADSAAIREAVSRTDPDARRVSSVAEARRALAEAPADLVVCDAACADPKAAHEALAADEGAPGFLAVVEPGGAQIDPAHAAYRRFLSRPVQPDVLAAVCRHMLDRVDPRTVEQPERRLSVREPARFSARPLYAEAVRYARDAFRRAESGTAPDLGEARLVAERLHTSLHQNNLLLIRALEPYKIFEIPTHCANVAIFAAKIAMGLDYSLERTLQVIQAGLLHDIGMARLPYSILEKEGPLGEEERREMERHPQLGAELVQSLGGQAEWLARAIRQEHERSGGQGYPDGLRGDQISELAAVIGVADVFEAFSHSRHHRSPFTAYEALERILSMREVYFPAPVVDALANEISVFPLDSYVRLSSGSIGRVVGANPGNLMRPTVEVLWDEQWALLEQPQVIELDARPDIAIERPLHESEVPIT